MEKSKIKERKIAFDFVIEELFPLSPVVKPMFGAHGVYIGEKIVFILRKKEDSDSGVWVATTIEHHEQLKKLLPSLRSIEVFGTGVTGWQVLPESSSDFEHEVLKACKMVLNHDPKIGKIPKKKKAVKKGAVAHKTRKSS